MKKLRSLISFVATVAICCSTMTIVNAAEGVNLSATRYRLPMGRFEIAGFGKTLNEGSYKANIFTDLDKGLFKATVEAYPLLGATNKAVRFQCLHDMTTASNYTRLTMTPNKKTKTNQFPLRGISKGFPVTSSENGLIVYTDMSTLKWDDGKGDVREHYSSGVKPVIQEADYTPDGKEAVDESGTKLVTPWTYKNGAPVTLIWTKALDYTKKDGKRVTHSVGEVQVVSVGMDLETGKITDTTDESVHLPDGFCGYIISPFTSMNPGKGSWSGEDRDGLVNMQKIDIATLNFGIFPEMSGDIWFDDFAFYGPAFQNVEGAYDYGSALSNTNYGNPVAVQPQSGTSQPDGNGGGDGNGTAPGTSTDGTGSGDVQGNNTSGEDDTTASDQSGEDLSDESRIVAATSGVSFTSGSTDTTDAKNNSNLWWIWIIVAVVVLGGAGTGVYFYLKKKNNMDSEDEFTVDDAIADDSIDSPEQDVDSSDPQEEE